MSKKKHKQHRTPYKALLVKRGVHIATLDIDRMTVPEAVHAARLWAVTEHDARGHLWGLSVVRLGQDGIPNETVADLMF